VPNAGAVADMQTEDIAHQHNVDAMTSLAAIGPEASRHDAAMNAAMSKMSNAMSAASHCESMQGMTTMMDDLSAEMSTYLSKLRMAPDLDAARQLCADHASRVSQMTNNMDSEAMSMSCMGM
jgi:hypothetical protein